MSVVIWDYAACLQAAKQCNSKAEFYRRFRSAYAAAQKHHWMDEYKWFVDPREKWNRTSCYELARTCKTMMEFVNKSNRAYQVARVNGWLESYDWLKQYNK